MWKRGGRSSALDRAQALLSAKRSSRGDAESALGASAETQSVVGTSVKTRSASPNAHTLLPGLSDLSSVSSASEDPAAAAAAGKTQGKEEDVNRDLRPQSPLGGGGSRFLKRAPRPATNSSQSPVSKSQMQQVAVHRNVPCSMQGSQTAALNRLAEIESRIRSRKQAGGRVPKLAETLTSDPGSSAPPAVHASVHFSAQSSSDESLKGKRFLKRKPAVHSSNAAAVRSPQGPDVGLRSRAADAVFTSVCSETQTLRVVTGVSLESDEEDMRKLLGDSLDSVDNSFLIPTRPSTIAANKILNESGQWVPPSPTPHSPASPSRRSSPFRFTGQSQAHFSPSVLSSSPSPPCVSASPVGRLNSPPRSAGSPQHSLSSISAHIEVLSLEELFPVGPGSEYPHSEMSADSSEDFKINVMTLDDLGLTEETPGKEAEASASVPVSPNRQQRLTLKEKENEGGGMLDYQSDFESDSRTEPDYSSRQVSEHLQGHGEEEEVVSDVREEASDSEVSRRGAEDDYSNSVSDRSCSYTSQPSDRSQTLSRSRDSSTLSRSSGSHDSQTFSNQSRRRSSSRKVLKEAAVQTQPNSLAYRWPTVGMVTADVTYMDPTPAVANTLSAETVAALSTFSPAAFALDGLLKQQLAMTRRFIESSRQLHSSLVQSLEPPNYRYTTLEDTKEYIRKHRPPKLSMDKALEEVWKEMRDYHHVEHED